MRKSLNDVIPTWQIIAAVGFMDRRLEIPSNTDPHWATIIESCWDRYIIITVLRTAPT